MVARRKSLAVRNCVYVCVCVYARVWPKNGRETGRIGRRIKDCVKTCPVCESGPASWLSKT